MSTGRTKGLGLCTKHYKRLRRHGDPLTVHVPPEGCSVDGCGEKHYKRFWQHGDQVIDASFKPGNRPWTGEDSHVWQFNDITYSAAHKRVRLEHGSAADWDCIDCGNKAREWSYNRRDPVDELIEDGRTYSPHTANYEPRCNVCHSIFDRALESV